jgi:hypothetical protein
MICFLAFALSGFSKGTTTYTYIDGNNNTFTITSDSLIYDPIQPHESSSGTYSGGQPKRVALAATQFQKIEALIKSIQKDKTSHESTRQMGFGTLVVGKTTIFLNMNSDHKKLLEQELKACLG